MKNLIIICFLLVTFRSVGNSQDLPNKHSFTIMSGVVFLDGFIYSKSVPLLGVRYSKKLNKLVSLEAGLTTIYKTLQDPSISDFNIITRTSQSLLINENEKQHLKNVGIRDLTLSGTIKYLYLPLHAAFDFQPINIGRHHIGAAIGVTATYGSYKASRDDIPIDITLTDGTVFKNINIKQEIEFRNYIMGDSYQRIYYKYHFNRNAISLSLHSLNFLWSHDNTETNHLLTLDFQSQF